MASAPKVEPRTFSRYLEPQQAEAFADLFDPLYYAEQAACEFSSHTEAMVHYLEDGAARFLDPHPLFDSRFYVAEHPEVIGAGSDPLVHFVTSGASQGFDPSPYFDTDYYLSQHERLTRQSVNALAHYLEYGPEGKSCNPNPLFGNGFYLSNNPHLRGGRETPLAHYLRVGRLSGASTSRIHHAMLARLSGAVRNPLCRGNWQQARVVVFLESPAASKMAAAARDALAAERLDAAVVARRSEIDEAGLLVLEAFAGECDVLRPSAVRFLALGLTSRSSLMLTDSVNAVEGAGHVGSYFLILDEHMLPNRALEDVARRVSRIVFGSQRLAATAARSNALPHNVAVRPYEVGDGNHEAAEAFILSLVELAQRDARIGLARHRTRASGPAVRKVVVPCPDWSVSGVNAALDAVGQDLVRRGWDVEIVFTRDRDVIEQSAAGHGLPRLPSRFLERKGPGAEGMWEALIADVERQAPCIVFMAYDFLANSAVSAFTDDVGAVMWLQADDGDYYEQAYRLGRYCNAVVCVSSHIKDVVSEIHPGIGARSHVIHNTSIGEADVAELRASRSDKLRIVYTGRLVQYQKRILDFVPLADALEARGVPFEIALIGNFPVHDEAAGLFPTRAARHLEAGTIELVGRLPRDEILGRLRSSDFFVLLSDFEGLPLSLVEAMASGCVPVVAEMKSGISELLSSGEDGLVVAGRDYGQWADALIGLWRDPVTLAEMSQRARATVRESFTVERIAQQFDELFRQVAEEISNGYRRPPALHWGERRSRTGDVLPPPFMYRSVPIAGLG